VVTHDCGASGMEVMYFDQTEQFQEFVVCVESRLPAGEVACVVSWARQATPGDLLVCGLGTIACVKTVIDVRQMMRPLATQFALLNDPPIKASVAACTICGQGIRDRLCEHLTSGGDK